MNKVKNKNNKPKIRFPGFTDDWEQRKLGEVADGFDYGLNAAATDFDGQNKYIRITDIDDETRLFIQKDVTSPDTDLEMAENYILHEGDILFARTGASVGKSYIYKESDGLVYYAGFLIRAHVNKENNANFVFQNTLTEPYSKYIQVTSQRSGQPGVNAKEYQDFTFFVPEKEEQDKISTFLMNLDHLITLHQRKLNSYKKLKKCIMQKLFKREVRFKKADGSDYGEWEEKKFSDSFTEYNVKNTDGLQQYTAGKYGLVFMDEEKIRYDTSKHKAFHENTLVLGIGIDEIGVSIDTNGCVSPIYTTYDINEDIMDAKFVSYFLKQELNKKKGKITHKSTRRDYEFEANELNYLSLYVPSDKDEQIAIANCLSKIDALITSAEQKLDAYKKLKKCMLQQMFI